MDSELAKGINAKRIEGGEEENSERGKIRIHHVKENALLLLWPMCSICFRIDENITLLLQHASFMIREQDKRIFTLRGCHFIHPFLLSAATNFLMRC